MARQEAALRKHQWYDEQIKIEQQTTRDSVEVCLNSEMGRLEALHYKESKL